MYKYLLVCIAYVVESTPLLVLFRFMLLPKARLVTEMAIISEEINDFLFIFKSCLFACAPLRMLAKIYCYHSAYVCPM